MTSFANRTYLPNDNVAFTFNGAGWTDKDWTAANGTTGHFYFTYGLYENVTFGFPVPAIAFHLYAVPRLDTTGKFAICIDCNPKTDSYTTVPNRRDPQEQSPPTLYYSNRWSEPGIHKVLLWNLEAELTISHVDLEIPDPNVTSTQPATVTVTATSRDNAVVSVGSLAGAVIGSVLIVSLIGLLFFYFWKRTMVKRAGEGAGSDEDGIKVPPTSMSEIPTLAATEDKDSSASLANRESRGTPPAGFGPLRRTEADSASTGANYKGLPELGDGSGGTSYRPTSQWRPMSMEHAGVPTGSSPTWSAAPPPGVQHT